MRRAQALLARKTWAGAFSDALKAHDAYPASLLWGKDGSMSSQSVEAWSEDLDTRGVQEAERRQTIQRVAAALLGAQESGGFIDLVEMAQRAPYPRWRPHITPDLAQSIALACLETVQEAMDILAEQRLAGGLLSQ